MMAPSTDPTTAINDDDSPNNIDVDPVAQLNQFEIEPTLQSQPAKQRKWFPVLRYWAAATIAVLLTYHCRDTKLRPKNDEIDMERLAEVVAVFLLVLITFCIIQGSDPGYLTHDIVEQVCQEDGLTLLGYENDCDEEADMPTSSDADKSSRNLKSRRNLKEEEQQPQQLQEQPFALALNNPPPLFRGTRRKVCTECNFAPPLRTHHCRHCNKCVATFDHHCHFIGTCIGERNHLRFYIFVSCQLIGFLTLCSVVGSSKWGFLTLIRKEDSLASALVVVSKLYLYPLTFAAFLVWITHTFFALVNMTTFECGKGPRHVDYLNGTQLMDMPFSKGLVGNLVLFLCQRDALCAGITSAEWKPILWQTPGKIVRDSDDWFENPWQNKYWSCC